MKDPGKDGQEFFVWSGTIENMPRGPGCPRVPAILGGATSRDCWHKDLGEPHQETAGTCDQVLQLTAQSQPLSPSMSTSHAWMPCSVFQEENLKSGFSSQGSHVSTFPLLSVLGEDTRHCETGTTDAMIFWDCGKRDLASSLAL